MNSKTRKRAMRGFVASLLQSDLTARDMQDLADDLTHGSLAKELADFIRVMTLDLDFVEVGPAKNDDDNSTVGAIEAYDIITRRRLSKKFVLEIMMLASPSLKDRKISSNRTMRDMLETYFAAATAPEARRFLSILRGEPDDQYLKGISGRN